MYDRSVRYKVKIRNGSDVIIAKDTDERLLKSRYYNNNWFKHSYINKEVKIVDDDVDLKLTKDEQILLEKCLNVHADNVLEHGWYDIISVSDTLQ